MNNPQRIVLLLGLLVFSLLLIYRPYDVCGSFLCDVVYADYRHPPIIDPSEGGGADSGLLIAQLLLVVLAAATVIVAFDTPVRRWRIVGLIVLLGLLVPCVVLLATSFPMAAFDTSMFGIGIMVVVLTTSVLVDRQRLKKHWAKKISRED